MTTTPSARRRLGRNAFDPQVDPMDVQPYHKDSWGFEYYLMDWMAGWEEAEDQYNHPRDGGFITEISSMDTGGGCIVDFVHLKDGRVLGINDECICLYKSMEHFGDGDDLTENEIIDLLR